MLLSPKIGVPVYRNGRRALYGTFPRVTRRRTDASLVLALVLALQDVRAIAEVLEARLRNARQRCARRIPGRRTPAAVRPAPL
jgi:hypothetical protein